MTLQEGIKGNTIKGDRDDFVFRLLEWGGPESQLLRVTQTRRGVQGKV